MGVFIAVFVGAFMGGEIVIFLTGFAGGSGALEG